MFRLFVLFTLLSLTQANNIIYIGGMPYSHRTNGAYDRVAKRYNDEPVYERQDVTGKIWSVYRRSDGRWVLDFNDISENWEGTVAYTNKSEPRPVGVEWNELRYTCTADDMFYVRGLPYATRSDGAYTFNGVVHEGRPVYQHIYGSTTWSLYRRNNGYWYVDFNHISEEYDGSIGYTKSPTDDPTAVTWTEGAITRHATLHIRGAPYPRCTNGAYHISDETHNGRPVYRRRRLAVYQQADGHWVMDINQVDDSADGTYERSLTASSDPTGIEYGSAAVTSVSGIDVRGLSNVGIPEGVFTLSDKTFNNAPVYTRDMHGRVWFLFRRSDGYWYIDRNGLYEDLAGTIVASKESGTHPNSVEWTKGIFIGLKD